ncbi:MAG TPA: universal stress protein [Candidatus Avacidaminococcus intestinavium]|uniref:Universal stress protein n=1 Tax=Candidatus Avacidaminococcus intestinavium TaxID=2840684 RepID=A0A9D1MRA4_9FIRM|nr:universal stress protein [Candidatus Avacidaminococcus intestinavium]
MLNKILVSVDGSPLSLRALEFAMEMGKANGSEIIVLHVTVPLDLSRLHSYEMDAIDESIQEAILKNEFDKKELSASEQRKAGEWALAMSEKKVAALGGYDKISYKEVIHDEPAKTIIREAGVNRVDAIVIGYSGLGVLSKAIIGSVSSKVVANATCPVVIVR